MKQINRAFKTTFIFSTHDKRVISKADRLIRIDDGEISALGVRSETRNGRSPGSVVRPMLLLKNNRSASRKGQVCAINKTPHSSLASNLSFA